jgi:thiamine pyrophosphate-dependent acetolactate synthase large subunit-like protein
MSDAKSGVSFREALVLLRAARGERDVIITTMGAAREWMALGPLHPLDLVLVPSSMGQATSLGLGIALARPDRRVIVINGDGSMLMNLGSLVTIAAERPPNLFVVLADNGAYEVTGAQPTPGVGARVDFAAVARGCGFERVNRYSHIRTWSDGLLPLLCDEGPAVVVLDVALDPRAGGPRSPGPAGERARMFMQALGDS